MRAQISVLFTPLRIGRLELRNRIVIAPMCQYSAVDGCMTDWHLIHLGHLALSGAALLTIEATAVLPEGRITYADVGLGDDATEVAMRQTLESVRRWSKMPIALQLGHAGRKASTEIPGRVAHRFYPAIRRAGRRSLHPPFHLARVTGHRSRSTNVVWRGCGMPLLRRRSEPRG